MARDLPSLPIFADEIISALRREGDLVRDRSILEAGDYPAVAIALGSGHHAVLLRDHARQIAISLPVEGEGLWHAATRAEWSVTNEMRAAIARYAKEHPNAVSMADVIVALQPILAGASPSTWRVSFPGTPVPTEAWVRSNDDQRAIGLFQEDHEVKVVIWADGMLSMQITAPADFVRLAAFVESSLEAQLRAQRAAAREKERRDALPKPRLEEVKAKILAGERYSCGGRCHEDFYCKDGRIFVDVCDEGHDSTFEATDAGLQRSIDLYPEAFRR